MPSKPQSASVDTPRSAMPNLSTPNHRAQFIAARDSRNRRIPGLYLRGGRYYAQLWVDLGNGKKAPRRFPLRDGDNQPVRTVRRRAKPSRSSGTSGARITFPSPAANPSLPITSRPILRKQRCTQAPRTLENERQAIERWRDYLGHVRIDQSLRRPLPLTSTSG